MWQQTYDPLNNMALSTCVAALPVVAMLLGIAVFRLKAHVASGLGLATALLVAILVFQMPAGMAARAAVLGALTGLLPIGWIILNLIFLHRLTEANGSFRILQDSVSAITEDRRLQLLLIAFSFGAFFEGAAGFGAPVAVTASVLIWICPPASAASLHKPAWPVRARH